MGGLGGFFPPLLLGFFRDRLGVVWPGFVLLAATALALLGWLNRRVFVPRQQAARARAAAASCAAPPTGCAPAPGRRCGPALLVAAIVVGSRNLQNFDPALVIYTFAVVFATWGVVYHYNVWLDKPPTRRLLGARLGARPRREGVLRSLARRGRARPATHLVGADASSAQRSRAALVDAPVPLLGLPAGGGDHVPAGLRLDSLRHRARTTR